MNFAEFLFWSVGLVTAGSAVMVAVSQNIVRAAVWLLFTLAGVSGLFFLLGADFLGAVQLIVYVGGILILVVFGVMLTAQGPFVNMKTAAGEWVIALLVGLILLGLLSACILNANFQNLVQSRIADETANAPSANRLGTTLLGAPEAPLPLNLLPEKMKQPVAFLFPFEIVSIHLLAALIGAAYLARAKRQKRAAA